MSADTLVQLHAITRDKDGGSNYFKFGDTLDCAGIAGGTVRLSCNATKRRPEVLCTDEEPRKLKANDLEELLAEADGPLEMLLRPMSFT